MPKPSNILAVRGLTGKVRCKLFECIINLSTNSFYFDSLSIFGGQCSVKTRYFFSFKYNSSQSFGLIKHGMFDRIVSIIVFQRKKILFLTSYFLKFCFATSDIVKYS